MFIFKDQKHGRIDVSRSNYEDASKHLYYISAARVQECQQYYVLCPRINQVDVVALWHY